MHILINDFIGGVLDRGIPLYVRNLIEGLREEGLRVRVIRAPKIFRIFPRSVFYVISVFVEQFVMPAIGLILRPDRTLYPYNSISILDVISGRGRIVVHDLELLNRSSLSPSKLYCLFCYRALKYFSAPVFTIADIIRRKIIENGTFEGCTITILPNTFYVFENLVRAESAVQKKEKSLLLCTGSTENKDLANVASHYLPKALHEGFRVSILGLHKDNDIADLTFLSDFINSGQLRLCDQLSDQEVVREYKSHAIAWVHSLREGFGRSIVEARLAGSQVICSHIPEFEALKDEGVFLYENLAQFALFLTLPSQAEQNFPPYTAYPYRDILRKAVAQGL